MKEIPQTKLRSFYEILKDFSTETHLKIIEDYNRSNNLKKLERIYLQSRSHFEKYSNINEEILSRTKRKMLIPPPIQFFNNTFDVISFFADLNKIPVEKSNNKNYCFEYIDREVSTYRTTNAKYATGLSAKSSGTGGLDFIGVNLNDNYPILGEIKVKGDKNPFFALIQLLTYCSELSTAEQISRIKNKKLFGTEVNPLFYKNPKYYFYIVLVKYNNKSTPKSNLLMETKKLAIKVQKSAAINNIKEIVFLELDETTKKLNIN